MSPKRKTIFSKNDRESKINVSESVTECSEDESCCTDGEEIFADDDQSLADSNAADDKSPQKNVTTRGVKTPPKMNVLVSGENPVGQMALKSDVEHEFVEAKLFPGKAVDCAAGDFHSLILTNRGRVFSFGQKTEGQLGRGRVTDKTAPLPRLVKFDDKKIVKVTAGRYHSAALSQDGKVFVWGKFYDSVGVFEKSPDDRTHQRPNMLDLSEDIVDIASGSDHILLLSREGQIFSFGVAEHGRLGRIIASHCCRENRRAFEVMLVPKKIPATQKRKPVKFTAIWASRSCSFARSEDGVIWGCGLNDSLQLGEVEDHCREGGVFELKPLACFDPHINWKRICGGDKHTLALDDIGNVYALGASLNGNLGLEEGEGENKLLPLTVIPGLTGVHIVDIACGPHCSFALDNQGHLWSWGQSGALLGQGKRQTNEHVSAPMVCKSADFSNKKVVKISAGHQHAICVILDTEKQSQTTRTL